MWLVIRGGYVTTVELSRLFYGMPRLFVPFVMHVVLRNLAHVDFPSLELSHLGAVKSLEVDGRPYSFLFGAFIGGSLSTSRVIALLGGLGFQAWETAGV